MNSNNTISKLFLSALMLLISQISFAHFGSKGPFGGTVTVGITNDTVVYLGTAEGGVFESTNSSIIAWRARPVGLLSGKINALTHSGKYLFAGTADGGVFRFTGYVGSDRYWEKVNTGLSNLQVKSLAAVDSITVLAGTNGGGLFKTTNKGASWSAINSASLNNANITAIVKAGNRFILTTANGGVFKSDDNGDTWQDFNDVSTLSVSGTFSLSYNATSDEILVLTANGLFVAASASTANAASYTSVAAPFNTEICSISNNGTNWYLATDKGVYSSATGSISFTAQNNALTNLDVTAVVPFQTKLVAGTNHGSIYKTSNSSISWTVANTNYNNLATYAMFTNGTTLVIAATEKGVHVSTDLAASYKIRNTGLTDSLNVTDLTLFGTKLLASTKNGGVFVSADTAKNWSNFSTGLSSLNIKKIIASTSFVYALCATGEIYRSDVVGAWTLANSGLPLNANASSLAFYDGKILLGTYGNGVYTSDETSINWTAFGTGLSNQNVTSVATLVKASGTKLFAGTDGAGVFVTDATTGTWTATAALSIAHTTMIGLNGTKVEAMATYGGYVFASYQGGLLATKDAGKTWIAGGNQFNLPSYTHVNKITFVTTRVFVVTDNNDLYSNALSELDVVANIESSINVKCHGACNASATAKAIAGNGTYTYLWSDNQSTATATNLCPGKYFVTITSNAKTSVDSVVITEPTALDVAVSSTISSGTNGTATALASGGTAPYFYLWSNSGNTAAITGLAPGNYTVTITDDKGCSLDSSVTVKSSVGIASLENAVFSLSPNPSNDGKVILNFNTVQAPIESVTLYDCTGKLLQNISGTPGMTTLPLNINGAAGVYFVKVNTATSSAVSKVIIE